VLNKDQIDNLHYLSPRAMRRHIAESDWDNLAKCRQGLSREYGDEIDVLNESASEERLADRQRHHPQLGSECDTEILKILK